MTCEVIVKLGLVGKPGSASCRFFPKLSNCYSITTYRLKNGPYHTCPFKAEPYLITNYYYS